MISSSLNPMLHKNRPSSRITPMKAIQSYEEISSMEANDVLDFYHSFSMLTDQDDETTVNEEKSEMKTNVSLNGYGIRTFNNKWNVRYNELKAFHKKFGHCNVPNRYIPNEKLGVWVRNQRSQFKRCQDGKHSPLNPCRISALKKLGFEFNYHRALWAQRYCELKQFKNLYGHCNVPHRYQENFKLGEWVATQRKQFKRMCSNQSSHLSADRIEALSALGFEWKVKNNRRYSTS